MLILALSVSLGVFEEMISTKQNVKTRKGREREKTRQVVLSFETAAVVAMSASFLPLGARTGRGCRASWFEIDGGECAPLSQLMAFVSPNFRFDKPECVALLTRVSVLLIEGLQR